MENLAEYPVKERIAVAWGDMDALSHVNNTMYFKYFETVRVKYLEQAGVFDLAKNDNIGPVLVHASCDFKQSISYPDTLTVGARVTAIGNTSMTMEYIAVSDKVGLAALGRAVVVLYNFKKADKISISLQIREAIHKIEGQLL